MKAIKENLYDILEKYEKRAEQKSIGMSDVASIQQVINLLRDLETYKCDKTEPQPEAPQPATIMTRATNPGY